MPVQNTEQSSIANQDPSQKLDQIVLNENQIGQFMVTHPQLSQNSLNNVDNGDSPNYPQLPPFAFD